MQLCILIRFVSKTRSEGYYRKTSLCYCIIDSVGMAEQGVWLGLEYTGRQQLFFPSHKSHMYLMDHVLRIGTYDVMRRRFGKGN